jgi:hypothetical protein
MEVAGATCVGGFDESATWGGSVVVTASRSRIERSGSACPRSTSSGPYLLS